LSVIKRVEDYMTKEVVFANLTDSLQSAAAKMAERDIGSIVIVQEGKPIGIVTERDFVRRVAALGKDSRTLTVADIMSTPLVTVGPECDINSAAKIMTDNNIKRLPVVEGERLVGIITSFDIAKVMAEEAHPLLQTPRLWFLFKTA
jgi:CBS domain-containing protein